MFRKEVKRVCRGNRKKEECAKDVGGEVLVSASGFWDFIASRDSGKKTYVSRDPGISRDSLILVLRRLVFLLYSK